MRCRSTLLALALALLAVPAAAETFRTAQATFTLERWVAGLERPWGLAFLPDGRALVTERPGRLRLIDDGLLVPEPVAGLPAEIVARGQGGLLDVALVLTGTHPELPQDLRHRIAEILQVPALVLLDGARQIRARPGYCSRSHAVMAVLGRIGRGLLRRLRRVGFLLGRWGRPLEVVARTLRPLTPFRTSGTDPPGP